MVASVTPLRAHEPSLSDEGALVLYKHAAFARALDLRLVELQRKGEIGFHRASMGEELAILGAVAALREKDWVFHSGRELGAALWRGMPLGAYLSHLFGSAGDPAKGRPIPDSFGSRAARFASAGGRAGAHLAHAVGFAWGAKIAGEDVVTLACFGARATSSGDFHAAMNFAGVFKTATVFFLRDGRVTASSGSFWTKGVAYGVPGLLVDGDDLFAVHRAVREAVLRAARGEGATIVEASVRARDALGVLRQHLEGKKLWSENEEREHVARVRAEVDAAIAAAASEPTPPRASMFDDVYASPPWHLHGQRDPGGGGKT
jgi:2-oxoisovalerate dehydrogenase E1 component alpha subunit